MSHRAALQESINRRGALNARIPAKGVHFASNLGAFGSLAVFPEGGFPLVPSAN
jgi:hypothetical protein